MKENSLRILMVLRAPVGGLYRHVIDLSDELGRRCHKVGLVMDATLSDAQTDARIAAMDCPPALGVFRIPIPRLLGPSDLTAAWRIRAIAGKTQADILHGHGAKGGFNARLAGIGKNRRVSIYTPHGGVLHFSQRSVTGKLLRSIERLLLPISGAVIFESAFARNAFESRIGAVPCLAPVVHNGLRDAEFAPLDPDRIDFDFSFVGELRNLKGVSFLLDALVGVRRKNGDPATLIIGGSGPDEAAIRQQIAQLELSERVQMVGVQPALKVFERARVAVMPSLAESLPYVALEASAAGKPLLATDVGGVSEIFGPTADALLPPADAGALERAMQACLDEPEQAQKQARRRREWVRENFSVGKMADGIEETYRACLAAVPEG